jgi:hypothetical protein
MTTTTQGEITEHTQKTQAISSRRFAFTATCMIRVSRPPIFNPLRARGET